MNILELIGWFVFGFLMYQLIAAWVAMQQIKHLVRDALDEKASVATAKRSLSIRFEPVEQGMHSVVLVYDIDSNRFLGQANTYSEAKEMLVERYPNIDFVVVSNKNMQENTRTVDTKTV